MVPIVKPPGRMLIQLTILIKRILKMGQKKIQLRILVVIVMIKITRTNDLLEKYWGQSLRVVKEKKTKEKEERQRK